MDVPNCSNPRWLYEGSCACSDLHFENPNGITNGLCTSEHWKFKRVFCYLNTYDPNDPCCQETQGGFCMNYDLCDSPTAQFSDEE